MILVVAFGCHVTKVPDPIAKACNDFLINRKKGSHSGSFPPSLLKIFVESKVLRLEWIKGTRYHCLANSDDYNPQCFCQIPDGFLGEPANP